MGWSAGTFSRVHDWTSDEAGSFPNIESARMDQEDDNFATGINTCLAKDGQNTPTADLPMGANKHTGVGNAAARDQYVAVNQIQDGDLYTATSVSGTDTIVGTMTPAITAYTNGMRVLFEPAANNTGAATLNLNSVGAQSITKNGTTALAADDLISGAWADCIYDLSNTNWVLINPQTTFATAATSVIAGAGMTGGGALTSDVTVNAIAGTGITVNANDIALSHLGFEALTDPGGDRIAFWDDSASAFKWLSVDGSLNITTTVLSSGGTAIKTADETVASSTTMQDDDHLTGIALEANQYYSFEAWIHYTQNVGDLKLNWVFDNAPQNSFASREVHDNSAGYVTSEIQQLTTQLTITTAVDTYRTFIKYKGYFQSHASSGGNLKLQWAQNTSSANNTTIYEGSWVKIQKLS